MNYNYYSIKVIDGNIKAVVNKEAMPNVNDFKSTPFCESGLCKAYFDSIKEWQQKHEVFEFAKGEEDKIFNHYNQNVPTHLEVTCIEIKYGKSWFKEEKWLITH